MTCCHWLVTQSVTSYIYTTQAQGWRVCCFSSLWDSSSSRLGSTPPSAGSTVHCRQQPLLRESPPVERARPSTFHTVYCLGVSPTPPGGLEHPVIRATRAPCIKNCNGLVINALVKPTLKLCSSHSVTGISKTPGLVTSLEPVPLLFRARGTTRESLIEGAK